MLHLKAVYSFSMMYSLYEDTSMYCMYVFNHSIAHRHVLFPASDHYKY